MAATCRGGALNTRKAHLPTIYRVAKRGFEQET
jgi:hypothetical protein